MEKTFTFLGRVRRNHGGQIIVDTCASDVDHLRESITDLVTNRPQCRKAVDSCFEDLIGKDGKVTVTVSFDGDWMGAVPGAEIHTAKTAKYYTTQPGAMEEAVIAALEDLDGN